MSDQAQHVTPEVPDHRLDAVLGAGASAVVWAGVDASGRRVAVKVPHDDDALSQRSVAEQQVLLAVRHDHLVTLRSVVPLADGREALVFDRVDGVALAAMVEARGHLRTGEIVTVLTPLCDAVATLHRAGGLHGDISAGNVSITPEGRPVLLDLGAARVAGAVDEQVWGTSGFLAPEVVAGAAPSESSDVYALGALAWFCATGNGAPDTMLRLDRDVVASHVGEALADAIGACIDPDPAERPPSEALARLFFEAAPADPVEVVLGADLASALTHRLRAQARDDVPAVDPHGRRRRPRWLSGAGVASGPGSRLMPTAAGARVARAVRRPLVAIVGAAVVAVGLGGWAVTSLGDAGGDRPEEPGTVAATATATPHHPTPTAPHPAPPVTTRVVPPGGLDPALEPAVLLRSPTAPADHAADLLQVLADTRTRALVGRDVAALAAVHRTGGPSWTSDQQVVRALRETGTRWEGLRLEVATATYVPPAGSPPRPVSDTAASDTPAAGTTAAVVRARIDWTAYTVVTEAGARAARATEQGELLDFHLVRGAQGWRIESISRPPAS